MIPIQRRFFNGLAAVACACVTNAALVQAVPQDTQPENSADQWKPMRYFLGSWEGTGEGFGQESKLNRTYEFILEGKFVFSKNKSVFDPPNDDSPGETHEDWAIVSYDTNREKLVLRSFHVEGFVNQYVLKSMTPDGRTIVFVTEHIENIEPGWRARETYRILSDDEFEETFELAAPGGDFKVCVSNRLHRKR